MKTFVTFRAVSQSEFLQAFQEARSTDKLVKSATSTTDEIRDGTSKGDLFILASVNAGFVVKRSGELVALYSTYKGLGKLLVKTAVQLGANHLDCFDGYLVKLYSMHGFIETKREANWTEGQPDVVYMVHYSNMI